MVIINFAGMLNFYIAGMLTPKSLESSQELFQMVCHVVRDRLYISTDRNLFLNFLQRIRAFCLEVRIVIWSCTL